MNRKIKNSNGYIFGSHRKWDLEFSCALFYSALIVLAMVLGGVIVHAYHIVNGN